MENQRSVSNDYEEIINTRSSIIIEPEIHPYQLPPPPQLKRLPSNNSNGATKKTKRNDRNTNLLHASCEISPNTNGPFDQMLSAPPRRRDYFSESEIDRQERQPYQGSDPWINQDAEGEESDEYSRQVTCYSDKTTERGGPWSSYQHSTLGNLEPGCKICFDRECRGCRYLIGFAKTRLSGGVQVKHWLSLPNVRERMSGLKKLAQTPESVAGDDQAVKSTKFTRSQKQTLICIGLVNFASFLAMSIIAPFFPREAAKKGMREAVSGFVFSTYALVMMIASPIFGKYLPHIGTNFLYMSGILVSGVSNMLFGVLDRVTNEVAFTVLCFVVRSFEALGAAAFSTASYTIILDMFPDNISTVFGLIETCVGVGMSIGPAVGGGLYSVGGYGLPFFVLGAIVLINIPLSWCLLGPTTAMNSKTMKSSYKKLLSVPLVVMISVVVVVASQAQGFIDPTLEPHLRQYNIGPEIVGLLFLVMAVAYAFFSPAVGYIIGKWETKYPMMLVGLLMMTVSLLLLGPSPFLPFTGGELWLNIVAIVLLGISFSLAFIPTFEAILDAGIEGGLGDNMGTYCIVSGLWNSMCSLGEVAGPSLGGLLSDFLDFPLASTVMAVFPLATAVLVSVTWMCTDKKVPKLLVDPEDAKDRSTIDDDSLHRDDYEDERTTLLKTPDVDFYYQRIPPLIHNIEATASA